jgi:putative CocE/NonD family hydrolase
MGADVWRSEESWPLPDTRFVPYYLHSDGRAALVPEHGTLSVDPPVDEQSDLFVYDPHDPVPTIGGQTFLPGLRIGANAGPRDQRTIERRPDVACYTTPVLERDTEVTGPITLTLYASSSARDTDFTGKLVDVHPDGRAMILTEGILRARYRSSTTSTELLEPGEVYELTIDLWATANVFKAGHRIRLEVSSSNFPRFDRNLNTGGVIAGGRDSRFIAAENRVYHDARHPSHVVLPLIERETAV